METENVYYDVYPRIVKANTKVAITIKERYGQLQLQDQKEYEIRYYPMDRQSHISEYQYQEPIYLSPKNGILKFEQYFTGEQEHIIEVQEKGNESWDKRICFRIYSLEEDLFHRRPYKGDIHMHTLRSDGTDSPAFLAAACRKIGLDFMAITDHELYYPSVEAQRAFENVPLDILICRGEEVHPENNPTHIVNFGADFSINEWMKQNKTKYFEQVKKLEKQLSDIKDEDAKHQCASCLWVFNKIREGNGYGVFCHPYWERRKGNYISETVISYLLEHQPYDALELISGYYKATAYSNTIQAARYNEERAKGKKIPIVGVSDSHGSVNKELFGWYYTIVFSPSFTQKEIGESIKELYSVAVEHLPDECARPHGPFRLVRFAMFLIREIFPLHDELCLEEGIEMMKYISGQKGSLVRLTELKGQNQKLYDKLWA